MLALLVLLGRVVGAEWVWLDRGERSNQKQNEVNDIDNVIDNDNINYDRQTSSWQYNSEAAAPPAQCGVVTCRGSMVSSTAVKPCSSQLGVLWFLHVGKTGGTTVMKHMQEEARLNEMTYVDFFSFDRPGWSWSKSPELKRIQEEVFGSFQKRPRVLVNHHHGTPGMTPEFLHDYLRPLACAAYAKGCTFTLATLLRRPLSHLRSFAVYKHFLESRVVKDLPPFSFRDFLDNGPRIVDFQSTYIEKGSWATDYAELSGSNLTYVTEVLRTYFSLVGFTENLNEFLEDAFEMSFGIRFDRRKTQIANKSPVSSEYASAFDDIFLDDIAKWVAKDGILYQNMRTDRIKTTENRFSCPDA